MTNRAELLWLDLEMTGLDPKKDKILEVAVMATDWDFNEIASFQSGFGYPEGKIKTLLDANPFFTKMKDNKKALLKLTTESPKPAVVEKELIEFVRNYFNAAEPVLLAGNSIHIDRQFIHTQLPKFEELLHYRMLDVSAWKVMFEGKFDKKYHKQEVHRALDDLKESVAELQYYLKYLHVGS